jgi:hypothetical protein
MQIYNENIYDLLGKTPSSYYEDDYDSTTGGAGGGEGSAM